MCSVLMSKEVCNASTPIKEVRLMMKNVQSDAEYDITSAAKYHMPSDAPDKEVDRAYCWFFEMALVVGPEHIVDAKISQNIVEDVFKAHADYRKGKLSQLKVITFSLQTDQSKSGLGRQLIVEVFIQSGTQIWKATAKD